MRGKLLGITGAVALWAPIASAAMPKQAVCAMQQAVVCGSVEVCERVLPGAVNLPALMRFDVTAGVIESRRESGEVRKSKIGSSSEEADALVLNGIDDGHPWAMRVDVESGNFTLTVLRDDEGFLGFGVCSAKILD
ncbi:MAG: hypothetical protein QNK04_02845 [Myxococcota bacterium]|nr:hypothetical protein [Myxococcota bacterium]